MPVNREENGIRGDSQGNMVVSFASLPANTVALRNSYTESFFHYLRQLQIQDGHINYSKILYFQGDDFQNNTNWCSSMKLYLTWNDALIKKGHDGSPELKYVTKQEESKDSPSAAAFALTADMTD